MHWELGRKGASKHSDGQGNPKKGRVEPSGDIPCPTSTLIDRLTRHFRFLLRRRVGQWASVLGDVGGETPHAVAAE